MSKKNPQIIKKHKLTIVISKFIGYIKYVDRFINRPYMGILKLSRIVPPYSRAFIFYTHFLIA